MDTVSNMKLISSLKYKTHLLPVPFLAEVYFEHIIDSVYYEDRYQQWLKKGNMTTLLHRKSAAQRVSPEIISDTSKHELTVRAGIIKFNFSVLIQFRQLLAQKHSTLQLIFILNCQDKKLELQNITEKTFIFIPKSVISSA